MPYIDYETSSAASKPIELFDFQGSFNNYFLTSYALPITSDGRLYTPTPMRRSKVDIATQNKDESALEIEMPFDHPLVQEYAYDNTPPSLLMSLKRCHEQDPNDSVLMWQGRVTAFTVEGRIAKLRVPTLFSYLLEGNTPTPRFQAPCNHVLYDVRCGVDPALHQHITTVASINNNNLTLTSLPFAAGEAAAGILLAPGGESRMVIANVGTAVTVSYPFAGLQVGDTVTIRKGCDHAFEGHCKTRFNNGARFGGFPLVPAQNPFTSTLT